MIAIGLTLVLLPIGLMGYAYVGYPLLLRLVGKRRPPVASLPDPVEWPRISIVVPAYNEEPAIRRTIDSLLALDYPADRRQILVVSDASTDGTDAAVCSYAPQGVELLRLPQRGGRIRIVASVLTMMIPVRCASAAFSAAVLPPRCGSRRSSTPCGA